MATLKERELSSVACVRHLFLALAVYAVSVRLKSVKSIEKITKSMKMVSAAKYSQAERQLKPARTYGVAAQGKRDRERERERGFVSV